MTSHARTLEKARGLVKAEPKLPGLICIDRGHVALRAGTAFDGHVFTEQTKIEMMHDLVVGADYGIVIVDGAPRAYRAFGIPAGEGAIGGFHFAPGGNALAQAGGDDIPAINPFSCWDLNFRPTCPDPRGMTLVQRDGLQFWADIYLLGKDHLIGTSTFGATIADHWDPPQNPAGGYFGKLDFEVAKTVMAHHGKSLLSQDEFRAFAFGVTEHSACDGDPKVTGLDAKHTSQVGGVQSSGGMWVWGIESKERPRASIFGGSWLSGSVAGSRFADVGLWPGNSDVSLGARGRSDHLQLV